MGYMTMQGCKVLKETAKAIQVKYNGKKYWLPKSQINFVGRNYVDINLDDYAVPLWLWQKNGMTNEGNKYSERQMTHEESTYLMDPEEEYWNAATVWNERNSDHGSDY